MDLYLISCICYELYLESKLLMACFAMIVIGMALNLNILCRNSSEIRNWYV